MSYLFFYSVLLLYAAQAMVDCVCMFVTIVDPFFVSILHANSYYETEESSFVGTEDHFSIAKVRYRENSCFVRFLIFLRPCWETFLCLYTSTLFVDSIEVPDVFVMNKVRGRLFLYFMSSVSIVRVCALIHLTCGYFKLLSILYLFEALVFEYEGFTAKSLVQRHARVMSVYSGAMSFFSLLLCMWQQ